MTVEIREARPEEYEPLGEIAVLAYGDVDNDSAYLPEVRDVATRAATATVLAAIDSDGTLLGSVTYVSGPDSPYAESEAEDEAGFRMLSVAPWAQGRGIGRALVEHVIGRARREGRGGIAIYTRPSMAAAHHLYEGLGFRRDRSFDWEYEPGEWLWGYRLRF